MVRRAEQANFKALVVTVDTVLLGRRLATERNEIRYGHLNVCFSATTILRFGYCFPSRKHE